MRSSSAIALVTCLLVGMGCEKVGQFSARPLAWPSQAYGGETVSVAIGTNNPLAGFESVRAYDVSTENVILRLTETSTGTTLDVLPRAIVSSTTDPATVWVETHGATEIQVAIFDLPTTMPFASYPADVDVIPVYAADGTPVYDLLGSPEAYADLRILGETGGEGSTLFWPNQVLSDAEPLPGLRLRAVPPGFDPAWTIGSVQLDVSYPASLSNPRPFAKGEAVGAAAHVAETGSGTARVVLVHPQGFNLADLSTPPGVALGTGPFLDLGFDKSGAFGPGDFTITNLLVTDVDGAPLIDQAGDSSAFFQVIARRNQ